jgi:dihydrofolate reductase
MRKLIVTNIISLDGNYEGPGRNVMMLPMDPAFDSYNLERMQNAGTVLLGENSYKFFGGFWPSMAENMDTSETNREFSRLYNKIQKVAVSDKLSLNDAPTLWKDTSTFISTDTYEEVEKLKNEEGKDIVMFASRMLWNDLMKHGLVDELHFVVGNVVLGDGTKVFNDTIAYDDPSTVLELVESRKFENSNNHLVIYKVTSKKS